MGFLTAMREIDLQAFLWGNAGAAMPGTTGLGPIE
jgi:hypothetical protein